MSDDWSSSFNWLIDWIVLTGLLSLDWLIGWHIFAGLHLLFCRSLLLPGHVQSPANHFFNHPSWKADIIFQPLLFCLCFMEFFPYCYVRMHASSSETATRFVQWTKPVFSYQYFLFSPYEYRWTKLKQGPTDHEKKEASNSINQSINQSSINLIYSWRRRWSTDNSPSSSAASHQSHCPVRGRVLPLCEKFPLELLRFFTV